MPTVRPARTLPGLINSRSSLRPAAVNFSSAPTSSRKALYNVLPAPDFNGVQNPPGVAILKLPGGDPGLPPQEQFLFGTGGTGLPNTVGPDRRITNVNTLPPGRSR